MCFFVFWGGECGCLRPPVPQDRLQEQHRAQAAQLAEAKALTAAQADRLEAAKRARAEAEAAVQALRAEAERTAQRAAGLEAELEASQAAVGAAELRHAEASSQAERVGEQLDAVTRPGDGLGLKGSTIGLGDLPL